MNILRALLGLPVYRLSDGGGGDGGAGARQEEEERRKAELRARIDRLYGIDSEGPAPRRTRRLTEGITAPDPVEQQSSGDAADARMSLEGERTKLGDATRKYHADQLSRAYTKAERNARFELARRSVLGGSSQVDSMSELDADRNLGATRVDEAVRRAMAQLESAREQERLSAISLVNSGAGESAVSAAQRGIQNSFANEESRQRADLTSDLFSAGANAFTASNLRDQDALARARYDRQVASFFNAGRTASGRVTPSS